MWKFFLPTSCVLLKRVCLLPHGFHSISETLTDYFKAFGEVIGVEIKMDALTGRSRFVKLNLLSLF